MGTLAVDTSALVAVALGEPEREAFVALLAGSRRALLSAATLPEAELVLRRRLRGGALEDLLERLGVEVVAFTAAHARHAADGLRRYGRGAHPARLNLGDAFAYGLAKAEGLALLFKGEDFALTDLTPAWRPAPPAAIGPS